MPDLNIFQQLHDALSAGGTATVLKLAAEIDQLHSNGEIIEARSETVYELEKIWCNMCQRYHCRIVEKKIGKDIFWSRQSAKEALKGRSICD